MHIMYVDESGDPGFPRTPASDWGSGPTTHFVRAGAIVHGWKWANINDRLANFKKARNVPWDAEIKAHHLRTGRGAFQGWPPAERREFLNDFLDTLAREVDLNLIEVVIDKRKVDQSQRPRYSNPAVFSLELLLERYSSFLRGQKDRCGITVLDSCEAASDENLRYFHGFLREYSSHLESQHIVESTLFMKSHTTNMLQVADVCANVFYRYHATDGRNADEYDRIKERIFANKEWP